MPWQFGLKVVIAVIFDQCQQILVTQRPLHVAHGGCWEFPGGKIEHNESSQDALIREVKEELGVDVKRFQLLGELQHLYADKSLQFTVYQVTQFVGKPSCLVGQLQLQWIPKSQLNPNDFPAANAAIIAML